MSSRTAWPYGQKTDRSTPPQRSRRRALRDPSRVGPCTTDLGQIHTIYYGLVLGSTDERRSARQWRAASAPYFAVGEVGGVLGPAPVGPFRDVAGSFAPSLLLLATAALGAAPALAARETPPRAS